MMKTWLGSYLYRNSEVSKGDRRTIATKHDTLHRNMPEGHLIQPGEDVTKETTPEQHLKDA